MSSSDHFPPSAHEFLHGWFHSQGNVRRFLEDTAVPPIDDETQREAGLVAATTAIEELYGLDMDQFASGMDSVSGAFAAAGAVHITPPDPDIPQDTEAAAFFDIDNTLIQGSSLVELALGLAKKRYFRLKDVGPVLFKQLRYRLSGSEHSGDMQRGREQALNFVRGRKVSVLQELCDEIVSRSMAAKTYSETIKLAQMHLAAGQQVWLVSATPVQIGQTLAKHFGFTGALGTVAEEHDGVFTGKLLGDVLHGPGKRHAVAALAAFQGLDLEKCTAYSDSINDIPMLTMVGTPVAINPDRKLKKEATKRGWVVRDYRSMRRAIQKWGVPSLLTAAITYWGWRKKKR